MRRRRRREKAIRPLLDHEHAETRFTRPEEEKVGNREHHQTAPHEAHPTKPLRTGSRLSSKFDIKHDKG